MSNGFPTPAFSSFSGYRGAIVWGEALATLRKMRNESIDLVFTSPPYWLQRNYGVERQIGLERSPQDYVSRLGEIFEEVRRVLRKTGTLWINIGDTYAAGKGTARTPGSGEHSIGHYRNLKEKGALPLDRLNRRELYAAGVKPKDLVGIPWRLALALQSSGWWIRSELVWWKTNAKPESVSDRPRRAHETILMCSKSARYFFDRLPLEKLGEASIGSVWSFANDTRHAEHDSTFPIEIAKRVILCGSPASSSSIVLDPFSGLGTTGAAALALGRHYIGIEIRRDFAEASVERLATVNPLFARIDLRAGVDGEYPKKP